MVGDAWEPNTALLASQLLRPTCSFHEKWANLNSDQNAYFLDPGDDSISTEYVDSASTPLTFALGVFRFRCKQQ